MLGLSQVVLRLQLLKLQLLVKDSALTVWVVKAKPFAADLDRVTGGKVALCVGWGAWVLYLSEGGRARIPRKHAVHQAKGCTTKGLVEAQFPGCKIGFDDLSRISRINLQDGFPFPGRVGQPGCFFLNFFFWGGGALTLARCWCVSCSRSLWNCLTRRIMSLYIFSFLYIVMAKSGSSTVMYNLR